MIYIILLIYLLPLLFIFSFSLMQLSLIISYLKGRKSTQTSSISHLASKKITIQLPIYNERYVIERLLDAVADFDYPKDKFDVQVLDDSTDESVEIVAQKIAELKLKGVDIEHVRRENRTGFKAGALAYGLAFAKGEFIAIFDADFVPQKDFLKKTIPYFEDNNVGVVQTRWTHLNENYSLLTQLQAFGLDAHFTIEQIGRNAGNHFINFNGTAGVWRKATIEDAGGWQADTLTEDLDLSYRAQIKGWKFVYLPNVESPAELPMVMNAIKSQQYRWTKGAAECSVKNLKRLFSAPKINFSTKMNGFYHLMNSSVFVAVLLLALLSLPVMLISRESEIYQKFFIYTSFFQISWLILGVFYWISFRGKHQNVFEFVKRFFLFLTFMMGLSLHNSIAVIEGWMGKKTPFVRTPKFNLEAKNTSWKSNLYLNKKIGIATYLEILLCLYLLFTIILELYLQEYGLLPFHLMLVVGYLGVIFYTFKHSRE